MISGTLTSELDTLSCGTLTSELDTYLPAVYILRGDRPHGSLYINFKVINNETQEEEIETFRINERIDRLVDDESGNPV